MKRRAQITSKESAKKMGIVLKNRGGKMEKKLPLCVVCKKKPRRSITSETCCQSCAGKLAWVEPARKLFRLLKGKGNKDYSEKDFLEMIIKLRQSLNAHTSRLRVLKSQRGGIL